jgi:3',5'-cyclic AMP phosphodiesterase CpdA
VKIAQISDLHFTSITLNPFRLLSKRILGHFNWLFHRKSKISEKPLQNLPETLKQLGVDLILLNGDFTSTSLPSEFAKAQKFIAKLPSPWIAVPGNHDKYTYRSERRKDYFYYIRPSRPSDHWSLSEEKIEAHHLQNDFWLIALDTTRATNIFSSRGIFSERLENQLKRLLALLPQNAKIALFTHYPFLQNDEPRRELSRASHLEKIIQSDPRIKVYLHGHSHRQTIANLQPSNLPLILDSGCVSHGETASFHLLEILPNGMKVELYRRQNKTWQKTKEEIFEWTR